MPPPLLQLQDISLSFGVMPLLSGATLAVAAGDRICLVGRNGSGKSTLLRIAAGLVQADTGERFAQPGATIQYLPQELDLAGFGTTLAYVEAGFDSATADRRHRALYLLKELGLSGDEDPASLSGGEARRAALACALAPSPDASCQIWPVNEVTARLGLPPGHAREEQTLAEIEDFIDWGAPGHTATIGPLPCFGETDRWRRGVRGSLGRRGREQRGRSTPMLELVAFYKSTPGSFRGFCSVCGSQSSTSSARGPRLQNATPTRRRATA